MSLLESLPDLAAAEREPLDRCVGPRRTEAAIVVRYGLVVPLRGAGGQLTTTVTRALETKRYSTFNTDWGEIEASLLGVHQAVCGIDATRTA